LHRGDKKPAMFYRRMISVGTKASGAAGAASIGDRPPLD